LIRRLALSGVFLTLSATIANGQTVGVGPVSELRAQSVNDSALLNVVVNGRILKEQDLAREARLFVRVVEVAGESGSAKTVGTEEVVSWIYVAVSDYGEVVEQRAYRLGPVYDPKVERLGAENRTPVIYLAYGVRGNRRRARITVDLKAITIWPARP
jgi:hypothetical protein